MALVLKVLLIFCFEFVLRFLSKKVTTWILLSFGSIAIQQHLFQVFLFLNGKHTGSSAIHRTSLVSYSPH